MNTPEGNEGQGSGRNAEGDEEREEGDREQEQGERDSESEKKVESKTDDSFSGVGEMRMIDEPVHLSG